MTKKINKLNNFESIYSNMKSLFPIFCKHSVYADTDSCLTPAKQVMKKVDYFNIPRKWKECYEHEGLDMRTNRCKDCYNLYDCYKTREKTNKIKIRSKEILKKLIKYQKISIDEINLKTGV